MNMEPRTRNSYQKGTDPLLMCLVCLTKSHTIMYKLSDELDKDANEPKLTNLKALENVTCTKIVVTGDYPRYICPICLSMLKMSLEFIMLFKQSQITLKELYGDPLVNEFENEIDKQENIEHISNVDHDKARAPVEVIFCNNKYNLNDVLLVEKDENEKNDFAGFLRNLGKEVSASFVQPSKLVTDQEKTAAISISVLKNNRILPLSEIQLDEDANLIKYTIKEEPPEVEHSDNVEYIEIDILDKKCIDSLIIETDKELVEQENNNTTDEPRRKKIVKVGKRKKAKEEEKELDDEDLFEKEIKFPCEICKHIYSSKMSLRLHKKRVHFRKKEKDYTCEICGYQSKTRSGFVHHKLKHVGRQFKCNLCAKSYATKAVLKVHMGTHVNERQHLCNVCGKGFNYANALGYHMRLHTGEKNYQCNICERRFRMPNSLQRHLRTHTGDRPYECRFCERAFCSKGEVACHENIHTGFRPYHCKYCRKGFTKTHNLKLHLLSHKGPHVCEICGRSFVEMAILSMHMKISHKDLFDDDDERHDES